MLPAKPGSTGTSRGSADGSEGGVTFAPGMDSNLSWNTTAEVGQKPILVYLFDGHVDKGERFDFAASIEKKVFSDARVSRLARDFVCEKICVQDDELFAVVPGREVLRRYLETMKEKKIRKPAIALLTSSGDVLQVLDKGVSVEKLISAMQKARDKNSQEAAAPDRRG